MGFFLGGGVVVNLNSQKLLHLEAVWNLSEHSLDSGFQVENVV